MPDVLSDEWVSILNVGETKYFNSGLVNLTFDEDLIVINSFSYSGGRFSISMLKYIKEILDNNPRLDWDEETS